MGRITGKSEKKKRKKEGKKKENPATLMIIRLESIETQYEND